MSPKPIFLVMAALSLASQSASSAPGVYQLEKEEYGAVLKNPKGEVVFRYLTKKEPDTNLAANSTSCFHPVFTPGGKRLTDLAPGDHHHHRGIFLAWHDMQFQWKEDFSKGGKYAPPEGFGIARGDYWGWGQFAPTEGRVIVNHGVKLIEGGADHAVVEILDDWNVGDKTMIKQVTKVIVWEKGGARVMDLDYQLKPTRDLKLGHQAFGGFCVRARNDGESHYADNRGKVELPDAHYSMPKLNWPARAWYDYTITLKSGETLGCAVIDHFENPPSTWHNPRYVWMINPCIVSAGDVGTKAGETLRLRYRLVIHDGPTPRDLIEELSNALKEE